MVGMGASHLHQALQIFRGSLLRRFGYVARNVDPQVAAVWLSGFDGFCAWTLESMLRINGTASPGDAVNHIQRACRAHNAKAAAGEGLLQLATLGPASYETLPLLAARLPASSGGFGLPQLGVTCRAAFVAQLQVTLAPRLRAIERDVATGERAPEGVASAPIAVAYRQALHTMLQTSDVQQRMQGEALTWAAEEDTAPCDASTYIALRAEPLTVIRPQAPSAPTSTPTAEDATEDAAHPEPFKLRGLQRYLTELMNKAHKAKVAAALRARADGSNRHGDSDTFMAILAQWRSQSAPHARAWLDACRTPLNGISLALMTLISLFIEPWNISGAVCPFDKCSDHEAPTCVHALGCIRQHERGPNQTHTAMKRCLQQLMRDHGVLTVLNEDKSVFSVGLRKLSGDTVMPPGGMALCATVALRTKGIIIDNAVRAPAASSYLSGSAFKDGFAAAAGERAKISHHSGRYNEARYQFVPFIQETFGRLGDKGGDFVRELAVHSAQCKGGSMKEIQRRRARVLVDIRSELSVTLARALAERVFAYVRGAVLKGRHISPVSALLDTAGA